MTFSYPPQPQTGLGYRTYPASLARDLVSFWPLDETRGNRYDRVGRNHFFQDAVDVLTEEGKPGLAGKRTIYFPNNGTNVLRAQPSPALGNSGDTGFTITFWLRLVNVPQIMRLLFGGGGTNRQNFQVNFGWPYTYNITFSLWNASDVATNLINGNIYANTWYFIAMWYDPRNTSANVRLNASTNTANIGGPLRFASLDQFLVMGRSHTTTSYPIYGRLQDLAMWKRVLSLRELGSLYNDGRGSIWFEQTISPTWQQRFWAYPSVIEPVMPASPIGGSAGVRLMDAPMGAFTGMRLPQSPLGGDVAPHLLGVLADPPYGAHAGPLPLPDAPLGGHAGPLEGLT